MKEYIVDLESLIVEAKDKSEVFDLIQRMIRDGDIKIDLIAENL